MIDADTLESPEDHLEELGRRFAKALALREKGDDAGARPLFEEILRNEPRLAEPRLELAHIHLLADRFSEAGEHARLAVATLRAGGQWTEDIEPKALLSFAVNLLGETIVRELEEGEVFLTDREAFVQRWNEASRTFEEALEIDAGNVDAARNRTRFRPIAEGEDA